MTSKLPIIIPSSPTDTSPSYLARHINIGFNSDDVAALINSIDSSQKPSSTSSLAHLPAELLLQILEYVPVDYVLDWRLVCRGFRDAIDGRILYHHLRRTELIGYMGSRYLRPMEHLNDEQYEKIHLLRARFRCIEKAEEEDMGTQQSKPVWSGTHALFQIDEEWFRDFRQIGGAAARGGDTTQDADTRWLSTLDRLELQRPEEGFGTLRWCIRLDYAVLDMDFPLEAGRNTFDVDVHLHSGRVRVAWREMLFRFLKTERSLRRLLEKALHQKRNSDFSFTHTEDCLRATRRQRLHSSLNPNDKVDRHIKWTLRLLHPLFGKPRHDHQMTLEDIENDATNLLLLLRREASMSISQVAYLHQLSTDYQTMDKELVELDQAFGEFKTHMAMPGFQMSILMPVMNPCQIARNPIAWPDKLRAKIEGQVERWKSQKKVVEQIALLLEASNVAMAVPDDSFDDLESDF
ncbi:hypothetical protein EJ02DRAFT_350879 [Clathrospora elynae]|uniref:F-box domain-containing protein n=1 Tax=Clathrospora elynae TaxID=706981 RepID=A0A6A5SNA4_9PLEO|nr:hypothetical protein EJ02DRAFT_350879 [Clathrospora elynae]